MKKGIYIVIALLLPIVSFAQYADHRNRRVDSLEQVLATNPPTGEELSQIYYRLAGRGLDEVPSDAKHP
jgi:hypothetical protein